MKTKFIEGPWNLEMPKKKKKYYAKLSGKGWSRFAKVCVRIKCNKELDEEGIANAKLIAAAPELYEACNEMVLLKNLWLPLEYDHLNEERREEIIMLVRSLRKMEQAIKKATE